MQLLEVSCAVRRIYRSLGLKGLKNGNSGIWKNVSEIIKYQR